MNKKQIKQKIEEMLNSDDSFKVLLNKEIDKFLNSGFVDLADYENDYRLPTMKPMLQCGHRANATTNGKDCCAICAPSKESETVVKEPNLIGRKAICPHCKKTVSSNKAVAFFEYRPDKEYDLHYDGCWGWN